MMSTITIAFDNAIVIANVIAKKTASKHGPKP